MSSPKARKTRNSVKKIKQENEISNSKQLSQKNLKRKFSEEVQLLLLPPEQKSDCCTPLASTQFETHGRCNTSSKNCSFPGADEIITIDDDDDESDYPSDKSTQQKKNENVIENTDIEDINIRHETLNNHTSTRNYANELKSIFSIDPVKYQVPQEFCPVPSTSKDDETIFQNEQIFKEFYNGKCLNSKVTDNLEIIENPREPMITENTDNQELSVITKAESEVDAMTLGSKISFPVVPNIIDTIDLSNIDVEKVIAENDNFLKKLHNKRQRRIEKSIKEPKPEPEEIIEIIDNSCKNKQLTAAEISQMYKARIEFLRSRTYLKLSGRLSPDKTHQEPRFQSKDLSQNVSTRNCVNSVKSSLNDQSREVETRIRNSPNNTITNVATDVQSAVVQPYMLQVPDSLSIEIVPINTPVQTINSLNTSFDQSTAQSLGQSSSSQINNPNQNLFTNDIQSQQVRCTNTAPTSNTADMGPERENPGQNLEQPKSISTCPICIEPLDKKKIASTICGHIFCMPCIETAFKYPPKKCPTCRQKLTSVGYHVLYLL